MSHALHKYYYLYNTRRVQNTRIIWFGCRSSTGCHHKCDIYFLRAQIKKICLRQLSACLLWLHVYKRVRACVCAMLCKHHYNGRIFAVSFVSITTQHLLPQLDLLSSNHQKMHKLNAKKIYYKILNRLRITLQIVFV